MNDCRLVTYVLYFSTEGKDNCLFPELPKLSYQSGKMENIASEKIKKLKVDYLKRQRVEYFKRLKVNI